ncbi:Cupin domain-containing protein [Pleurostoma richardsiae]|uniref:Cupin domain-containing protein n=1 Tax=Pleurostoma richardsiae TaxID=41990 RepID=A0AA38VJW1_9PEZI|nr:Cupin domain-containing protein [Pleurostoma richardsiae]
MASESQPLPSTRRIVTAHNDKAKAVIARDGLIHGKQTPHGPWIQLLWSSPCLPPDINTIQDMGLVDTGLANNGTIVRVVDFPPRSTGISHRSTTLDYIFVLKGEIVLTLDDGSRTLVKENEAVVQQATMHSWDNETEQWARLLCILIASQEPVVNGVVLGKDVPTTV